MSFVLEKGNNPENYNFDRLLKEFKKRMESDNILPEFKKHMFHVKPGERKRRKKEVARRRKMKKERKNQRD